MNPWEFYSVIWSTIDILFLFSIVFLLNIFDVTKHNNLEYSFKANVLFPQIDSDILF